MPKITHQEIYDKIQHNCRVMTNNAAKLLLRDFVKLAEREKNAKQCLICFEDYDYTTPKFNTRSSFPILLLFSSQDVETTELYARNVAIYFLVKKLDDKKISKIFPFPNIQHVDKNSEWLSTKYTNPKDVLDLAHTISGELSLAGQKFPMGSYACTAETTPVVLQEKETEFFGATFDATERYQSMIDCFTIADIHKIINNSKINYHDDGVISFSQTIDKNGETSLVFFISKDEPNPLTDTVIKLLSERTSFLTKTENREHSYESIKDMLRFERTFASKEIGDYLFHNIHISDDSSISFYDENNHDSGQALMSYCGKIFFVCCDSSSRHNDTRTVLDVLRRRMETISCYNCSLHENNESNSDLDLFNEIKSIASAGLTRKACASIMQNVDLTTIKNIWRNSCIHISSDSNKEVSVVLQPNDPELPFIFVSCDHNKADKATSYVLVHIVQSYYPDIDIEKCDNNHIFDEIRKKTRS